jgi:hypothetical protein
MAAYNIEKGGLAQVTSVLRSNYAVVEKSGFSINSVDFGEIEGWRPTNSQSTLQSPTIRTEVNSMQRSTRCVQI